MTTVLDDLAETLLRAAAAMDGTGERIPLHHEKWAASFRAYARSVRLLSLSWHPANTDRIEV